MRILYKFASRSRPDKFIEGIENIFINSRNKDFIILASLDEDDPTMNNTPMIDKIRAYGVNVCTMFGKSKNKVDAINRDLHHFKEFDLLINFSDDMRFIVGGYDLIIEEEMKKHFPEGDGLLHFPDQNQGSNCMTMSIMDKKYFDRFRYIYHPDYESLECDVEAQEVGKRLGRYKFIDRRIFNHYHPSFQQAKYDYLYKKNEGLLDEYAIRRRDKETYLRREKNNFYL